ncbi:MAG: hypothetical protein EXR81_06650, partial [Gammaproteobacteria bacterium]|nr:hypothetical protein [Gammaproteobacteria bacterium]
MPSPLYVGTTYPVVVSLTNTSGQSFWLNALNNLQLPTGFSLGANTCSGAIQLAAGQACTLTGTFTPAVAGVNSWSTQIAAGGFNLPETYTASALVAGTPSSIGLTTSVRSLNFAAPVAGTTQTQSVTFETAPIMANLSITAANLPSGVTASACTTGSNGVCTMTFTASATASGTCAVIITASGIEAAPELSVSVASAAAVTLTLTTSSSMQIANGGYINLVSDMTTAQTYTITPSSAWQNASVTLTNGPTNDTGNIFFSTTCIGTVTTSCTVSFNTNVTHTPSGSIPASIKALDFSDPTIQLTVSGSNLSSTLPSWKVAPVVGQFMQGGVVFWVGDANNPSAPGYRQALVAAVKDVGDLTNLNKWGPTTSSVSGARYLGLFAGPSGVATGLTNTNAICSNSPPYTTTCSTSYPAAAAA